MNKAKQFYEEVIKCDDHIIGGSVAIKKQIPSFREPSDLDIMLNKKQVLTYLQRQQDIKETKKSEYGEGIFSIVFNDDSKIDLIICDFGAVRYKEIDGEKYVTLEEIVKYKILLIDLSINSKLFNEHNKHLQDLVFIYKNTV